MRIKDLQKTVHDMAVEKGWWDGPARDFGEVCSNIHGEVSEAWEEHRSGRAPTEVYVREDGKPEGIPIELADVVIRVFDFCGGAGIDLEAAIAAKVVYNATRPYRHGGKKA